MLVGVQKRQIHFLAKEELFHGITKFIAKGMGCIPVNRKIHDHNALSGAVDYLNNDLCVGIFPEGTINRTDKTIMNFKDIKDEFIKPVHTGNQNVSKNQKKDDKCFIF